MTRKTANRVQRALAQAIIGGTFAGHLATFRALAETDFDLFPRIRAEIEMFGGPVSVNLDPINVRRAIA